MNKEEFNTQIKEFLQDTELHLGESLTKIEKEIKEKNPDADDFFAHWWAARILFFTDGMDYNYDFELSEPIDPVKITLTLYPDYGS